MTLPPSRPGESRSPTPPRTASPRPRVAAARGGQDPATWLRQIVRNRLAPKDLEDALIGAHFTVAARAAAGIWRPGCRRGMQHPGPFNSVVLPDRTTTTLRALRSVVTRAAQCAVLRCAAIAQPGPPAVTSGTAAGSPPPARAPGRFGGESGRASGSVAGPVPPVPSRRLRPASVQNNPEIELQGE